MKKKVLLIHTGGTIGMVRDDKSGALKPDQFYDSITNVIPSLSEIADINVSIPFLKDSSALDFSCWQKIAQVIKKNINNHDGIVITHGTDTLAYTASALSFMLINLPIPIILTGAQKPLSEIRSDARINLINSVELACSPIIKEIAISFNNKLLRGNRTTKTHINHFDAFDSPNYPPLATVGIDVDIHEKNLIKKEGIFYLFEKMDNSIQILKLFPGFKAESFTPQSKTRAIIIIGFGAGNVPLTEKFKKNIEKWIEKDKIVVLISETKAGKMDYGLYESGNELKKMGVLECGDMTFEATLTKLMFLLGQYNETSVIKKNFAKSLAGEKTIIK